MTLLQFPADRRMAEVKRCADALQNLHGHDANMFWRQEMKRLAAALASQGLEHAEISHQANLFMQAVQMELQNAFMADNLNMAG